jgi:hypothetical protein
VATIFLYLLWWLAVLYGGLNPKKNVKFCHLQDYHLTNHLKNIVFAVLPLKKQLYLFAIACARVAHSEKFEQQQPVHSITWSENEKA